MTPSAENHSSRWQGIDRPYSTEDVLALRGRFPVEHTLARLGAERLWQLLLLQQFHDILPGSSIREVYEDASRDFAELLRSQPHPMMGPDYRHVVVIVDATKGRLVFDERVVTE